MLKRNLIIILLTIAGITLFDWVWWVWHTRNPNEAGVLGDTVGGLVGPFINLLAAYLVYISFKAQVKANRLLALEIGYDALIKRIELVKDIYIRCDSLNGYFSSIFENRAFDDLSINRIQFHQRTVERIVSIQNNILKLSNLEVALFLDLYFENLEYPLQTLQRTEQLFIHLTLGADLPVLQTLEKFQTVLLAATSNHTELENLRQSN